MIEKNQDQESKNQEIQLNKSLENKNSLKNKYKELDRSHVQDRQLNPSRAPLLSEKQETDTDKGRLASQASIQTKSPKQTPTWLMPAKTLRVHSEDMTSHLRQENTHSKMPNNMTQTQRSEHANVSQTHQTESRTGLDQKIIMVVDDSQTVRNIMALILNRAGYRSVRVASAMEALHTLTELIPDLIFLDVTLPGMDGLDICKIIKENPRTKKVPVVMLSGNSEVFDKVMGRLAGASDYITKPFEPETIINSINKFCGQKSRLREGLWRRAR